MTHPNPSQMTLRLACADCISWCGVGLPSGGFCMSGYKTAGCEHYDKIVHCLNRRVYGEKRGCGLDCHECYSEFERMEAWREGL